MNSFIPVILLALTACADFDSATLIKRDRVLAAKVGVDGDPDRAWPTPGESATMTWVTASPGDPPMFSWTLLACPAATSTGLPACAGDAFATSEGTGPIPTLRLAIPADIAATAVVVTGAICASGTPSLDSETRLGECSDGTRVDVVSQHIFLGTDVATNHNPHITAAPISIAGQAWADGGSCDDLPVVKAGADRTLIGVTFDGSDRETFTAATGASREALQLGVFTTAGDVVQLHAYVEADDDRAASPIAVEWDPPSAEDVPADGLRVKFTFVVRDMRGGVDATTRELCVR
ncbi:MAG TPA: hypothetical protein VGM90_39665 [Kofleriaceae bacterium]